MSADKVYDEVAAWAKEFDAEFYAEFTRDPEYTKAALSIGRGGNKPRKDFALWSEVKGYMGFFFDKYYDDQGAYPENFDADTIRSALRKYLKVYDPKDEQTVWFDKIKDVAEELGFARETKEYKTNPDAYRGHVGDISSFIRVAVTGKQNSPDMFSVMQVLGEDKVKERIEKQIERLRG